MEKNEKLIRKILLILLAVITIYNVGKGTDLIKIKHARLYDQIIGQVYVELGMKGLEMYAPGILCDDEKIERGQDFVGSIYNKAKSYIGILSVKSKADSQKVVESEQTTAQIIEANANAIAAQVLAENQTDAITKENEDAIKENEEVAQVNENDEMNEEQAKAKEEALEATTKVADISLESLQDFEYLKNTFFTIDPSTTIDEEKLNATMLLEKDLTLKQDNSMPQILIYHTHSQEEFADSVEGDDSTTVLGLGEHLAQILREQYGYNVIHITQTFDIIDGSIDRNKAYNFARDAINKVIEENPTIEVVIDLHRDGVDGDRRLVTTVNDKPTAKIMFFNGLSYTVNNGAIESLANPYIADNLAFSFRLELLAAEYYPEFVRTTYLKGYRYNLHFRPKSLLLECGAQTNTVEEVKNAMEPFADILHKVLNGA